MIEIPATYFDPEIATSDLIKLHKSIDYNFIDISSVEMLPQIFRRLHDTLYNIKTKLRFNPDRCIDLLSSMTDSAEKANLAIASLEFEKRIITDEAQIDTASSLISNLKILKGFMSKDNKYVGIPGSINTEDKLKLLDIASNTCSDRVIGMITYITKMKKEHVISLNQYKSEPDISAIKNFFKQKISSVAREDSPNNTRRVYDRSVP